MLKITYVLLLVFVAIGILVPFTIVLVATGINAVIASIPAIAVASGAIWVSLTEYFHASGETK